MKQIAFLLFVLSISFTFAQVSKTEKSVTEKLSSWRKEYDDASFTYAFSLADHYLTFEAKDRYKRQVKFFQDVNKLIAESKSNGIEDLSLLIQAGEMLCASGRYSQAEQIYKVALEHYRKVKQVKTQQYADILSNLGLMYQNLGRLTLAGRYVDSAYHLRQEIFPAESSQFAISVNNKAVLERDLGHYEQAEELIAEAVRIHEKALTRKSLPYALSLNNQAMLYQSMGRLKEAEPLLQEAIRTIGENLKEKSISYGKLMTNLALLYQEMEKYADAEIIFLKVIKLKENTVGINHPDYAHIQHLLAALYLEMGPDKKIQVEGLLKKTVSNYKKTLGEKDADYASAINDLGNYYRVTGNFKGALVLLLEALQIRKETLPAKSAEISKTLEYLGLTYAQMNRMTEAGKTLKESADRTLDDIMVSFSSMSEAEISRYWDCVNERFQRFYAFALTQAKSTMALSDEVFEYRVNTKGFILSDYVRTKKSLGSDQDPSFVKIYHDWLDEKENLSWAYKQSTARIAEEGLNIDSLEKRALTNQKTLSTKSLAFAGMYNTKKTTFKQVKDKLEASEAAIEIFSFKGFANDSADSTSYVALVVTKERLTGPEVILFQNGNELEKKSFNSYKGNIKQKIKDEKSYSLFWEKMEQALAAKQRIYLSASGVFNGINPATLLLPSGKYLADEKEFYFVGNTRDLLEQKNTGETSSGATAVIFGYPDFGLKGFIPRLPGTKVEVEVLKDFLTANSYSVTLYQQANATEQKVKGVESPAILHLATHGYFLEEHPKTPSYVFGNRRDGLTSNPYLMSGLLFAGAEKNISGDAENGILRAPEIAQLALSNTDVVFLSATETLYGNTEAGDGLDALQKGFHIAGTRAVIISMWKVNDAFEQEFVSLFYSEYIKSKNKFQAFDTSVKSIRVKYPEPYFWGAFKIFY